MDPKETPAFEDPKSTSTQPSQVTQAVCEKYEKDNKTARTAILQRVSDPLFDMFSLYKSAKQIWDLLKEKYGADDAGRRKYAVHEFENLVADMKAEGAVVNEVVLCDSLVDKLPESWVDFKNKMKHDQRTYTFQQLINSLNIEEENRLVHRSVVPSSSIKANVVEANPGFNKPKPGNTNQNGKKTDSEGPKGQAHIVEDTENSDLVAAVITEANTVEDPDEWVVDTGASRHFCNNKYLFKEFESITGEEQVFMGNSSISQKPDFCRPT
ncbi:PREDICTED: uncharacterized protein LOC109151151 [Ipomoea nil]|uniref:uncharacterized protein LOC109151151 n=1 Tax=Ipomoea nil TaxID=35883 RepID=UPI00090095FD|nr:PREDICTED: uncharacterized protein LOC109151151 [Ipomoea nil]